MQNKPILNIRALRIQRGLKQYQLAKLIGVRQGRISDYESGKKSPSVERLPVIAAALGVEIGDLFVPNEN